MRMGGGGSGRGGAGRKNRLDFGGNMDHDPDPGFYKWSSGRVSDS